MGEQSLLKKVINIIIVCILIICIGFVAFMFVLNYHENGESNMPFTITKINLDLIILVTSIMFLIDILIIIVLLFLLSSVFQ